MNILMDVTQPETLHLAKELGKAHNVIGCYYEQPIYDTVHIHKPDMMFLSNKIPNNETLDLLSKTRLPTVVYGINELTISNDESDLINLVGLCLVTDHEIHDADSRFIPIKPFGNRNIYNSGYYQYNLEADFVISNNYDTDTGDILDTILKDTSAKVRIAGENLLNSFYYVGKTTDQEFSSLIKSAKIVVTNSLFEYISMIQSNICAVLKEKFNSSIYDLYQNEKLRRQYIKERQNEYPATCQTEAIKMLNKFEEIFNG